MSKQIDSMKLELAAIRFAINSSNLKIQALCDRLNEENIQSDNIKNIISSLREEVDKRDSIRVQVSFLQSKINKKVNKKFLFF